MTEKPAKGVTGFLLWDPNRDRHFFRVYDQDNKTHKDYMVCAENIKITIDTNRLSLFDNDDGSGYVLGWSMKSLGRQED